MKPDYVKEYSRLETTHWWFVVRKKIILQALHNYVAAGADQKILNIGAAGGASSQWLAAFGNVHSVENEPLFLQHLQALHIEVTNASAEALPFDDNSFDMVCAFDVVEHIGNHHQALSEMWRVCKPGGKICITVPAYQALWGRHDVANGHKRRYRLSTLRKPIPPNARLLYSTYFNTLLLLPIFIARKIDWLFAGNKPASSDFSNYTPGSFFDKCCSFIFGLELPLLQRMRLPMGVSLLAIFEKEAIE